MVIHFKIFLFLIFALGGDFVHSKSFSQKLIYSDTPDIGRKWQFGLRMSDVIVWDFHWNINDWVLIDLLAAGLPGLDTEEGQELRDVFQLLTLKSRPYKRELWNNEYSLSGGIKAFNARFEIIDSVETSSFRSKDESLVLFLTQGYVRGKHYGNLFSSISFRDREFSGGRKKSVVTPYFIPGYRYQISTNWSFGAEYFMTNTEKLPIKFLQYGLDEDQIDFYNPDRIWISFMFWGASYTREHLRVDLYLGNHISFQAPIIPVLGVGWDF